jgi:ATP-dependent Lhr-like helicase
MRFLLRWHQLAGVDGGERQRDDPPLSADADPRREGEAALADVLRQLEGHVAPAAAWEGDLLAARIKDYTPAMLDKLCAAGKVLWWRPCAGAEAGARKSALIRATPVMLCERETLAHWQQLGAPAAPEDGDALSGKARRVWDALRTHGASFFADLRHDAGLIGTELEGALAELVAAGLATCDSFAGLRALVMPADQRTRPRRRRPGFEPIDDAGRWSLTRRVRAPAESPGALAEPHVEHVARVLLRRYGVVFRKLLEREDGLPPWRELHYVLRRLEARGEVRGGRFVSGFSGEQFALPDAAVALRRLPKTPCGERICISALDPLNLVGIVTPGDKLPRIAGNRLLFEDGVPIAVHSGGDCRYLAELDEGAQWQVRNLLIRRQRPASYLQPPSPRPS